MLKGRQLQLLAQLATLTRKSDLPPSLPEPGPVWLVDLLCQLSLCVRRPAGGVAGGCGGSGLGDCPAPLTNGGGCSGGAAPAACSGSSNEDGTLLDRLLSAECATPFRAPERRSACA